MRYNVSVKINIIGKTELKIKAVVKSIIKKTLAVMAQPDFIEMSVKFVEREEIHALNLATRGVDRPTDVLSYPSLSLKAGEKITREMVAESSFDGKNVFIGDCAICAQVARDQAVEFGNSFEAEVEKLVCHSVLHLLGYDHIKDEDYCVMHTQEVRILGETND